jgi:hypothetical protein
MCLVVVSLYVARYGHSSVVLSTVSVLVMGGAGDGSLREDVWKTVDDGASWIRMTSSAGWTGAKFTQFTIFLFSLAPPTSTSCACTLSYSFVYSLQTYIQRGPVIVV